MCGRRTRGGVIWTVGLVLVLGQARLAGGAEPAEDALIRQGIELRRRQEDAAAFPLFKRAYELRRSPRAAAQMGLDELALGR
jgi:hypothetical protein